MTLSYGFGVDTELPVEEAEARVRELLKQEGFGVLTEIDVQRTLKESSTSTSGSTGSSARAIHPFPIGRWRPSRVSACCCPATWWSRLGLTAEAGSRSSTLKSRSV